jgi:16S rRNA processing protein RimM
MEATVAIAKIGRYRGTKGEMFIHPFLELQGSKLADIKATISWPDGRKLETVIIAIRQQANKTVCQLACSNDMDEARALVHGEINIDRSYMSRLDNDEFYVEDLVGLEVVTVNGRELGKVDSIINASLSTLMVIGSKEEYLVPFVPEIVTEIQLAEGKVIIDPPDGLLELNED